MYSCKKGAIAWPESQDGRTGLKKLVTDIVDVPSFNHGHTCSILNFAPVQIGKIWVQLSACIFLSIISSRHVCHSFLCSIVQ